jgi:hypothetical protein
VAVLRVYYAVELDSSFCLIPFLALFSYSATLPASLHTGCFCELPSVKTYLGFLPLVVVACYPQRYYFILDCVLQTCACASMLPLYGKWATCIYSALPCMPCLLPSCRGIASPPPQPFCYLYLFLLFWVGVTFGGFLPTFFSSFCRWNLSW